MSKKKSIDGKATIMKDVHDLGSASLRTTEVQGGLDTGDSFYAETALITCTSTGASDVLYVSNDNTGQDIIITDITVDVFNSDGDTADITFVQNPTGYADDKSLALANSMKTVMNAHFNDSGLQSSAITLANSLKTVMNNHYNDSGAQSSAITLANSLKTVLNAHYTDYGALTTSQTLANALKTSINNHFGDSGALSSANTLANSLKTVINAHYNDSGAQSSAITLANSLKTVMNAHYNDDGNLTEAMALANSLKTVVNAHYSDYGALTSAIALANSLQGTLNDHYGLASAISAANIMKTTLNAHYNNSDLEIAMTYANSLKATYNAHIADASEHTGGADSTNIIAANDATTYATLVTLITEMVGAATTSYHQHEADCVGGAGSYHEAIESADHTLASNDAPANLSECFTRLNDFRAKYNAHDADSQCHLLGGQHAATAAISETEEHTLTYANVSAANATDQATLFTLMVALLVSYNAHENDDDAGAGTYHKGAQTGDYSLVSEAVPTTLSEAITRLNDLITKYNQHEADASSHANGSENTMAPTEAGEKHQDWSACDTTTAASDLATLITLTDALITSYDAHDADAEAAAAIHDAVETADHSLISAAAATDLDDCVALLNDLKAKLNAHDAEAGSGCHPNDVTLYAEATADADGEHQTLNALVSAAAASDLATTLTLTGALLASYADHNTDSIAATPTIHIVQGTTHALTSASAPANLYEAITRMNDLKAKYNLHEADTDSHITGSLHTESTGDATIGEHIAPYANISAANASDLASLITLLTAQLTAYDAHDVDANLASSWVYHYADEGGAGSALADASAPATLDECISRVNDLKAKYNAHDAYTTAHTTGSLHQEANSDADGEHLTVQANLSAANATNQATLITLVTALMSSYVSHNEDAAEATPTYHILQDATASVNDLTSEVAPTTFIEAVTKLNDLKDKYNLHDAETIAHQTGSDHQESTADGVGTEVTTHNLNFSSSNTSGVSVVSGDEADVLTGGTDFLTEYDVAEGTSFTIPVKLQLGPSDTLGIQIKPDAVTTNYQAKVSMTFQKIQNED